MNIVFSLNWVEFPATLLFFADGKKCPTFDIILGKEVVAGQ